MAHSDIQGDCTARRLSFEPRDPATKGGDADTPHMGQHWGEQSGKREQLIQPAPQWWKIALPAIW